MTLKRLTIGLLLTCVPCATLIAQDSTIQNSDSAHGFSAMVEKLLPTEAMQFEFRGKANRFGHLTKPWETRPASSVGSFRMDDDEVTVKQTVTRFGRKSDSVAVYSAQTFFESDGAGKANEVTHQDHVDYLRTTCRFTPTYLLRHAIASKSLNWKPHDGTGIASGSHGNQEYQIHFSTKDKTVNKIVWLGHHEMWGDQIVEFTYADWKTKDGFRHPTSIEETTFDTKTYRTTVVSAGKAGANSGGKIPADHQLKPDAATKELIEVEKYSDHITFLHMTHTDSRTTVVEFRDFLMVIDSPKSSRNGQLILDKIAQLELSKPVRFFAFGHHHPHYLGGVRPFIAAGAKVLTTTKIEPYVKQLAGHSFSRQPDKLQTNTKPLALQTFDGETQISDGEYSVKVFDIGLKSQHTIDYLLFYFPEEKMLLQDDGIWLRENRPISGRTRGTYNAIKELKLDVVDSIQGWPTQNYGVRTKIKFAELESAITAEDNKPQKD